MAMFFPLPLTCTVQTNNPVAARSGQLVDSWVNQGAYSCLLYTVTGAKQRSDLIEFSATAELYLDPTTPVNEGDRIVNISDKNGNIVDAGVYEVVFVRRVPDFTGNIHHLTCKLRGVAGVATPDGGS